MRKVRPQDVKDDFASFVTERRAYFDRVEAALKGTQHEKRDMSTLSETTLQSTYVAFECFLSDLILAYVNRDFSQYQIDIEGRIKQSIESRFGQWASQATSFTSRSHIKVDDLETILTPESDNLTFKDVETLKQRCVAIVAAPHRNAIVNLSDSDSRLIDTVHAIRNFIAHRSPKAKATMNQRLASIVSGVGCPNENLSRGTYDIGNIGAFLKAEVAGSRRINLYLSRLSSIAAAM